MGMAHQWRPNPSTRPSITPRSVGLVGPGRPIPETTTTTHVPASASYQGVIFSKAISVSCITNDETYVVCPRNGLLSLSQQVAPPSHRDDIRIMPVSMRIRWAYSVFMSLKDIYLMTPIDVVIYAGTYVTYFLARLFDQEINYWTVEKPLNGLSIWAAIHWLDDQASIN